MRSAYPTVVHMLAAAAEEAPRREALVFGERRLDYASYASAVAAFAEELAQHGARGGRVATLMPNSIEACIASFAALASGAQHVPLNPAYTDRELGEILEDAQPAVLVLDEHLSAPVEVPHVVRLGSRRLEPASGARLRLPDPDSLALLQYTGGTTGRSKGVDLTHRAIATNVAQREAAQPTSRHGERVLCVMPLFHSYAMSMGMFLAPNSLASLVILERYRPDELLDAVERERVTLFPGSPTLYTSLISHPRFASTDWSSVHTCYSGSAALAAETLRRWEAAVGAPIYEGYGQTEAGPVLTFNRAGAAKIGAVGLPLPGTTIEVVDVETGRRVLPSGERGEIRARGPQLMRGYRNRPRESAEALRDGWLYTGDIGELDRDGFLYVRDRKKDMVIVGGYNVYPREVEEVLCTHPAVSEAAAAGAPDPYWGECLHAYVALRSQATPEALLEWCRERLARYKIPATLEILDALPKTSVNKLDKLALKKRWTN